MPICRPPIAALAAVTFAALAAPAPAWAGETAAAAAEQFYAAYLTLPSGGIPDDAGRAAVEPLMTASLAELLEQAAIAEAANYATSMGQEPPLVEGDLFTSLFEGARAYEIGDCEGHSATHQSCAVALTYDDPGGGAPVAWTDEAMLAATDEGWRLDDIAYGGDWDFAPKGTLRETLAAVIAASAPNP